MQIAFVASYDSEFKWASIVASEFKRKNWDISFYTPGNLTNVSEKQLQDSGLTPACVTCVPREELIEALWHFKAVVIILPGPQTEALLYEARTFYAQHEVLERPIFVTGFVGINIKNLHDAFLRRASADIICVNSNNDYAMYVDVCKSLSIGTSCLRLTGFPFVSQTENNPQRSDLKRVVFADQVAIPKATIERRIIYKRLCDLALARPDMEVVIKPRHRPGERTSHASGELPEVFFKKYPAPFNLKFDYTALHEQFTQTDLLLTVSSTAAFEALAQGIKVAFVGDLGISEAYGNHIFFDSGLIRTFDQIIQGDLGIPDPSWIQRHTCFGNTLKRIYEEISSEVSMKTSVGYAFPDSPYFDTRKLYYQYSKQLKLQKETVGLSRVGNVLNTFIKQVRTLFQYILQLHVYLRNTCYVK